MKSLTWNLNLNPCLISIMNLTKVLLGLHKDIIKSWWWVLNIYGLFEDSVITMQYFINSFARIVILITPISIIIFFLKIQSTAVTNRRRNIILCWDFATAFLCPSKTNMILIGNNIHLCTDTLSKLRCMHMWVCACLCWCSVAHLTKHSNTIWLTTYTNHYPTLL